MACEERSRLDETISEARSNVEKDKELSELIRRYTIYYNYRYILLL
ncbi:MAG: hypothetical protein K0Q94_318 [Paenibacillus sp.]|nr:hypothetical protein [Paenibacillus sp.]